MRPLRNDASRVRYRRTVRILHLCGTAVGAPWLCEILRELKGHGHEVTAVLSGPGPLAAALERLGVRVLVLDHDVLIGASPRAAVRRIRQLVALLQAERPDILHSHLFPSNVAGRIAAWLADVPIRLSMNAGPYYLETPILADLDLRTVRADTRVIASCDYTRQLYIRNGVPARMVELIYYGSNAGRFDPATADRERLRRDLNLPPGVPLVGMVAYFYPPPGAGPMVSPRLAGRSIKGHDVLLRAVPLVLERVPQAHFVLVGEGWNEAGIAHRQQMEDLAASLGVTHAVTFAGHRPDVPDVLAGLDVALQCSRSENLGGSVEALMMAAPLVVTRTGGLVDTVRHEETGLVVPSDDPPALAAAIVRLIDDRVLARRLGDAGRALMLERFTARQTGLDIDALYRTCAADPRFDGRPPRESGYRRRRSAVRWLWSPIWAFRLLVLFKQLMAARLRRQAARLVRYPLRLRRLPSRLWRLLARGR